MIQTEDKTKQGFAPPSALKRSDVICQRCFRLKHYNEIKDVPLSDDDFLKILHAISEKRALVVKLVDIFDFNGSWLSGIQRFAGNNDVVLVGNKVDLLPKSVNHNRVMNWMRAEAKELGLRPAAVHLISAEKAIGIDQLSASIEEMRSGSDVYVIGVTNVGKSTFINRIITSVSGLRESKITTSRFPGTTLDLIGIPLADGQTLYDTPGIINHQQMAHFVDKDELKTITPTKEIKPKIYQLRAGQTLFFGGLARLDFVKGNRQPLVCYFANGLLIHRTKLEKADALYMKQKGELLSPPKAANKQAYPPLKKHVFHLRGEKTDIVISGLGWITINGAGEFAAHAPEGVAVSLRKSLI